METIDANGETPDHDGTFRFPPRCHGGIGGDRHRSRVASSSLRAAVPACIVGTSLLPRRRSFTSTSDRDTTCIEPPLAVYVPTLSEVPVTDVVVVRSDELYTVGMMVRLIDVPEWARTCIVDPITSLSRDALTVPRYEFSLAEGKADDTGITLIDEGHLNAAFSNLMGDPAIDCPIQVRLVGDGRDEAIEVAGCSHIRLRPFDPSRDFVTEHHQTSERLLKMFGRLDSAEFTNEDVRAFCPSSLLVSGPHNG